MRTFLAAIGLTGNPHSIPPLPAYLAIVVATIFALAFVRKVFYNRAQPYLIGELLELALISGGASALIATPLISSAVVQAKSIEGSLNSTLSLGLAGIAIFLVVAAAWAYIRTDSEWFTLAFAILFLAMAATQSWVMGMLQWVVDWPISYIWRIFLTVIETVFNLRFG